MSHLSPLGLVRDYSAVADLRTDSSLFSFRSSLSEALFVFLLPLHMSFRRRSRHSASLCKILFVLVWSFPHHTSLSFLEKIALRCPYLFLKFTPDSAFGKRETLSLLSPISLVHDDPAVADLRTDSSLYEALFLFLLYIYMSFLQRSRNSATLRKILPVLLCSFPCPDSLSSSSGLCHITFPLS